MASFSEGLLGGMRIFTGGMRDLVASGDALEKRKRERELAPLRKEILQAQATSSAERARQLGVSGEFQRGALEVGKTLGEQQIAAGEQRFAAGEQRFTLGEQQIGFGKEKQAGAPARALERDQGQINILLKRRQREVQNLSPENIGIVHDLDRQIRKLRGYDPLPKKSKTVYADRLKQRTIDVDINLGKLEELGNILEGGGQWDEGQSKEAQAAYDYAERHVLAGPSLLWRDGDYEGALAALNKNLPEGTTGKIAEDGTITFIRDGDETEIPGHIFIGASDRFGDVKPKDGFFQDSVTKKWYGEGGIDIEDINDYASQAFKIVGKEPSWLLGKGLRRDAFTGDLVTSEGDIFHRAGSPPPPPDQMDDRDKEWAELPEKRKLAFMKKAQDIKTEAQKDVMRLGNVLAIAKGILTKQSASVQRKYADESEKFMAEGHKFALPEWIWKHRQEFQKFDKNGKPLPIDEQSWKIYIAAAVRKQATSPLVKPKVDDVVGKTPPKKDPYANIEGGNIASIKAQEKAIRDEIGFADEPLIGDVLAFGKSLKESIAKGTVASIKNINTEREMGKYGALFDPRPEVARQELNTFAPVRGRGIKTKEQLRKNQKLIRDKFTRGWLSSKSGNLRDVVKHSGVWTALTKKQQNAFNLLAQGFYKDEYTDEFIDTLSVIFRGAGSGLTKKHKPLYDVGLTAMKNILNEFETVDPSKFKTGK